MAIAAVDQGDPLAALDRPAADRAAGLAGTCPPGLDHGQTAHGAVLVMTARLAWRTVLPPWHRHSHHTYAQLRPSPRRKASLCRDSPSRSQVRRALTGDGSSPRASATRRRPLPSRIAVRSTAIAERAPFSVSLLRIDSVSAAVTVASTARSMASAAATGPDGDSLPEISLPVGCSLASG